MAPRPVLTSAIDLVARIESASPQNRSEILTELYNSGMQYLDLSVEIGNKFTKLTQELSNLRSVENLKLEIKCLNSAAIENLKSTAVLEYKLSESLLSGTGIAQPNHVPRSEPYIIDRKFTGEDRSLYQVFQKEIKIALKRNADRYTTLQS
ncbi:hypothetical protein OnM2_079010 [Erysiphe neolycopersici]|uniref:Uncharacterized protein n=1 Tax=Erysiphe neolycopersici TaxID=212602 RepID=A0A420HGZ6_9PEZI|nr:hypothetical protein OnM2_079010 [Erysiphe neolycopersici]